MRGSRQSGFTLNEVLVGSLLTLMVLGPLATFFRSHLATTESEDLRVSLKQSVDLGLGFLARELRIAGARPEDYSCAAAAPTISGYMPACTGFERITAATATSVTFQMDSRGDSATAPADGCHDDAGEIVTYELEATSGEIRRTATGSTAQLLLRDVPGGGFELRYFQAVDLVGGGISWTEMVPGVGGLTALERANVDRIDVTLTATVADPRSAIAASATQQTSIHLANPSC